MEERRGDERGEGKGKEGGKGREGRTYYYCHTFSVSEHVTELFNFLLSKI